jgi:hypothetical protein
LAASAALEWVALRMNSERGSGIRAGSRDGMLARNRGGMRGRGGMRAGSRGGMKAGRRGGMLAGSRGDMLAESPGDIPVAKHDGTIGINRIISRIVGIIAITSGALIRIAIFGDFVVGRVIKW